MFINQKDSTIIAKVMCAIIFLTFTFAYIYLYQTPTLTYEQHVLSGGKTVYHPLISAIVITVTGYIIHMVTLSITRLRGIVHALNYLPAMLFVGVLTSGSPDASRTEIVWGMSFWVTLILLIIFCIIAKPLKQLTDLLSSHNKMLFSRTMLLNLLTMIVQIFIVCNMGNGDEIFHREITAEVNLKNLDYAALAKDGDNSERTDSTLTLLRAIGLDHRGVIADSLFCQPVTGGVASFLFQKNVHPCLFEPRFMSRKKTTDYRLCALLAERDLDKFAEMLSGKCDVAKPSAADSLPKAYREALIIYQHQRSTPLTAFTDSLLELDYRDMRQLMALCKTTAELNEQLRQNYRNTYWYYFYKK